MKQLKLALPFLILASGVLTTGFAVGIPITWEESLKRIQENNTELKSANETYLQTLELESAARSGFLPMISASVSGSQSMVGSVSTASTQTDAATLSLSQNLFSGFSDLSKYKQAQFNTQSAKSSLQITEAKIRHDLLQGIASFIYAQDSSKLSQLILERRKENLRIVQLRFSSGRENKGSVLLSEAYFQQAQYDNLLSKENLKISQSNLNDILGFTLENDLEFKGSIPLTEPYTVDSNFQKLVLNIPEFLQAIAQEESAHLNVDISKSSFYPSLDLSASVGKTDQTWALNYDKWSTGLTLNIPLYSGGKDLASSKSNSAKWQAAMLARMSTQTKLITKLKQTYTDFLMSTEKIKVDEKFKTAALTRAEIARSKYNNGLMSFEEWDLVESDLILREKNAILSKRDRMNAEATWNQTIGLGFSTNNTGVVK